MKLIINVGIIAIALSLTGCVSNQMSELDDRISRLEKNPPAFDERTQAVVDIMIGGPRSSPNQPSKSDAVLALALFNRIEAAPDILRLAKATQNDHFRMQCVNALGWMKYEEATPYLKEIMKNDSYYHTRKAAAVALETITGGKYMTPENGFESKEMILERFKKEQVEKRKLQEK